jgi:hypothetical protein
MNVGAWLVAIKQFLMAWEVLTVLKEGLVAD